MTNEFNSNNENTEVLTDSAENLFENSACEENSDKNNTVFDSFEPQNTPAFEEAGVRVVNRPFGNVLMPTGIPAKLYFEKKSIKRDAVTLGLSFGLLIIFVLFWVKSLNSLLNLLGFKKNILVEYFSDPAVLQIVQILASSFMFTVPFLIIFKLRGERVSDLLSYSAPKKENRTALVLMGISFCSFANIAVSELSSFFSRIGFKYNLREPDGPKGIFGFLLSFIAVVLTPALVEEFACRGVTLGLLKKHGEGFAVVASSVIFGLMHGNFVQIPFAFLVGLVLGFIAVKSGSLWLSMAVHGFNNFVSLLCDYFLSGLPNFWQNFIYTGFLSVSLLGGLVGLYLYKSGSGGIVFKKSETTASESRKFKWFFISVPMFFFILFCLCEALLYFL